MESICDELRSQKKISKALWQRLHSVFGNRLERAWRLTSENRVKRYVFYPSGRIVWITVGQGGEYLVLPEAGYCGCSDFYFRVLDGEEGLCYHLLAMKLAEAFGKYDRVEEEDEAYKLLLEEWHLQVVKD